MGVSGNQQHNDRIGYDVVVVGAGPAGSSAAAAAARMGARTLIVDRAQFPRYKTCGGGLIGVSLAELAGFDVPVKQEIRRASFTADGEKAAGRSSRGRLLSLVDRSEFDAALLEHAVSLGAQVRSGVTVTAVTQDIDGALLSTSVGPIRARYVVGADGSASRIARHVGVTLGQVDLGLEYELRATEEHTRAWAGRIHMDWGPIPGSYGWVFPKGDTITVGVIARRGTSDEARSYLKDFVRKQGLDDAEVIHESGHLTRCRTTDSPLGQGRVLVAGDAAGLLEPWTREGISFALRSGRIAGECAAKAAGPTGMPPSMGDLSRMVRDYTVRITEELGPEMEAGRVFLQAFERHPSVMHALLTRTPLGWREFQRLTRGQTNVARVLRFAPARWLLRSLSGAPVPRTA
ncbi:geranylgeranyl reductase family protein [Kineosporia mesophila]|uniref:Geranylgeranyl reductase family protein n=1 Tax=Kineosporia mesophila TaxID=566012 RepID=A0ABP6ZWG6_9ACTN|nr:geranylgeranyl reductase family protein [Kineosporia mesophila]MCD5348640.1 geranylgeranyl reductase family protein [Kineosporia mesophila]